jgi:arylsulfatase A-like enzyme
MSDDHSAEAISCYGSRLAPAFRTPNLDRIGREGLRMDCFYSTNSICTPARASVMTGQYGHVNGVRTIDDRWNPNRRENLASLMRDAGYNTAIVGKWHLHCYPEGFDYFDVLPGQGTYRDPDFLDRTLPREVLENPGARQPFRRPEPPLARQPLVRLVGVAAKQGAQPLPDFSQSRVCDRPSHRNRGPALRGKGPGRLPEIDERYPSLQEKVAKMG